jgi:hypothetical protein
MYRNVRKITGFVSTLLLFALASPAQLDTGTITVAVKDPSGSVVLGAHVVLRNENTGIDARNGVSNEQGNFNAPLIPSGTYSVHVELPGFKSYHAIRYLPPGEPADHHSCRPSSGRGAVSRSR